MSFALRTEAVAAWAKQFNLTFEQVGMINGTAFWGFTLAMVFGGPLCDVIGMKRIVWVSMVGHLIGIVLTVCAWDYWSLFVGTLIFGIANGSVEAACNPLIASLYPKDRTTKLNNFHAWFPGGIVIGGLAAFTMGHLGLGWQVQFLIMLLPLGIYTYLFWGQSFPVTERVEQGVSTRSMFAACLNPVFLLMVFCMLFTAGTEFGAQNWIPTIMSNAGVSGILVLVWITGLMCAGRLFAGPFVHKLSPMGTLLMSVIVSAIGLYAMSQASGLMLFAAATIFALGVCFLWPTMLGVVSERFPSTGALGLAVMGGAGMLSASVVVPYVGRYFDQAIAAKLAPSETTKMLSDAAAGTPESIRWMAVQASAGLETLGAVAVLPALLSLVFLVLFLVWRKSSATSTH